MIRFSVIITVYNKENHVVNTIQSVLHQSVQDFEIIIVNDGSSDNSKERIEVFEDDRITVFHTKNNGAAAARNFGVTKAKGKYIALLDGDDYWHPYYLEEISQLQKAFPNEHVFATAIELQHEKHKQVVHYSIPNLPHQKINYFKGSQLRTLISSSSVVLSPEVFDTVGNFDTAIVSGQDTDLWIRIGLKYEVVFSKRICVTYLTIASSLSNTTKDVNLKCRFDKFEKEELENKDLKKVLDLNRFSLAILSKLNGDQKNFDYFNGKLNPKNLNWKQNLLLKLNGKVLKLLMRFKNYLQKRQIFLTVFK